MSNITDDIKYSVYEDSEVNETEVIIKDTEILQDISKTQKIPNRKNEGKGIDCLESTFTGKSYDSIKKKV